MPQKRINTIYTLFILEWRMLWRKELGSPKWKLWRYYVYATLLVGNIAVIMYRLINPLTVLDTRWITVYGFINTLFIWASIKVLHLLKNQTNVHIFSLSPLSKITQVLARLGAHWLYHTTLIMILISPSLLNMLFGGYPEIIWGYVILYILALPIVSFTWLVMAIIVHCWGVEIGSFFVKSAGYLLSIVFLVGIFLYNQTFEKLFLRWQDSLLTINGATVFFTVLCVLVLLTVWIVSNSLSVVRRVVKHSGGGATYMRKKGFTALLVKEYRMLFRVMPRVLLFLIFNYVVSFGVLWVIFRILNPNELYFHIGFMMFLFGLYVAAPGNILSECEGNFWPSLRTSPISIPRVLLAKTIAVYSIMAPISVLVGYVLLRIAQVESSRMLVSLLIGLLVAVVTVWSGVVERIVHLLGLGFHRMMYLSWFSLGGSLVIVVSTYFIEELNSVVYTLVMACGLLSYMVSIGLGLRWVRR